MFRLLGIPVADVSVTQAAARVAELVQGSGGYLVVTLNPEIVVAAARSESYRQALCQASLVVADGTGIVLASYLCGQPIRHGRVTGVDLVHEIVKNSSKAMYSVMLAGSTREVLDKTTLKFASMYNNSNIIATFSKADRSKDDNPRAEETELYYEVMKWKPDVLLLAFGHPRQELWIAKNAKRLPCKVMIGVGGSFDYISGQVTRAPLLLRRFGFEWFWRLLLQPKRVKRINKALLIFPFVFIKSLIVPHGTGHG